jgi:bifunctional N-acetylglucosamine-1-phosphate-uridyltransferase/glucosamine-1-phosphate-acetyltransferase GlmU-like protein
MSMKEEFARSAKIDWALQRALFGTGDAEAAEAQYTIILRTDKPLLLEKQPEKGITIRSNIGDKIYTADVTQEGLLRLVRDERVKSIQGSRKLGLS